MWFGLELLAERTNAKTRAVKLTRAGAVCQPRQPQETRRQAGKERERVGRRAWTKLAPPPNFVTPALPRPDAS